MATNKPLPLRCLTRPSLHHENIFRFFQRLFNVMNYIVYLKTFDEKSTDISCLNFSTSGLLIFQKIKFSLQVHICRLFFFSSILASYPFPTSNTNEFLFLVCFEEPCPQISGILHTYPSAPQCFFLDGAAHINNLPRVALTLYYLYKRPFSSFFHAPAFDFLR